ncbi:MAG: hypothetical protein HYV75_02110 [Opitutae bacterium]|nr:hypothetical protein [Opitutae bacterium]
MNRIYQGRVSRVQTLRPRAECGGKKPQHITKHEEQERLIETDCGAR